MSNTIIAIGCTPKGLEELLGFITQNPNYSNDFSIVITQQQNTFSNDRFIEIVGNNTNIKTMATPQVVEHLPNTINIAPFNAEILIRNGQINIVSENPTVWEGNNKDLPNDPIPPDNENRDTSHEIGLATEKLPLGYQDLRNALEVFQKKEKELIEAQTIFNALFENTQQGKVLMNLSYDIIFINNRAKELLGGIGINGITWTQQNLLDVVKAEHLKEFELFFQEATSSKNETKKLFHFSTSDKTSHIELCLTPVKNANQSESVFYHLGILDFTAMYESQAAMFAKDEILTSLLDSSTTFVLRINLQGIYTYANKAFYQRSGFEADQLIGKHYAPTVHPDDLHVFDSGLPKLFEYPGSVVTLEFRKPSMYGGYFLTSWELVAIRNKEGDITEIQCMGRDISVERRNENLLKKERDHLEMIVESGQLGTWDWDIETGNILFNKQWANMMGFNLTEVNLHITEWKKMIHPLDAEKVLGPLVKCIQGHSDYYSIEHREIAKDGSLKWILSSGKVFGRHNNGKALQILGIHQDITTIKLAEEKVKLNEERNTAILETMQEGIVMQDLEGKIISCNRSATFILGLSYEQLIGLKSIDPIWQSIKESGEPFPGDEHPAMVALKTKKSLRGVVMGINKPDGSLIWISINTQLLYKPASNEPYGVFSTFLDISTEKKAQLQLKKSEVLMRASMDASPEAIFLLEVVKNEEEEVVDFMLQEVNLAGLAYMGMVRDQAIGRRIQQNFPINDKHNFFNRFKQVYLGKVPDYYEYTETIGEEGFKQYYYQQILPLENGVAVYNRNITDKVVAESERVMLNNRLEKIAEQSPDMIYEYCLQPDGKSTFPYSSDKMTEFFGITPKEAAEDATKAYESIHPEDLPKVIEAIEDSAKTLNEWRIDFRVNKPNGEIIWLEGIAKPKKSENGDIVWRGVVHNFTERKNLELDLEKFSLLAKKTTHAILFTDANRNTIWVNEGFVELTGYSFEEVIGKKPGKLLQYEKTDLKTIQYMREKLEKTEPIKVELLNKSKTGHEYWIFLEIQPLFDKGNLVGFVSIEIDITERKHREAEQNKLIGQLTLTIDDLKQFSYIVSHNLRAPLANVLGLVNVIKNNPNDENLGEFVKMLEESAISLDNVIKDLNDLLALRDKAYEYEEVSLYELLSDCKQLLGKPTAVLEASIHTLFNGIDKVYSVKPILMSIFYNLIANAIKYSKEDIMPEITITISELENDLVYQFTDNGIGIDLSRHRNHIFGLYKRLNNSKEGKGIGLYLTKQNVKRLGGTISVESELGVGTTFTIWLPKKSTEV